MYRYWNSWKVFINIRVQKAFDRENMRKALNKIFLKNVFKG